ncbi:unnamed protein product, partial [Mesorhabditis spiculigera]
MQNDLRRIQNETMPTQNRTGLVLSLARRLEFNENIHNLRKKMQVFACDGGRFNARFGRLFSCMYGLNYTLVVELCEHLVINNYGTSDLETQS